MKQYRSYGRRDDVPEIFGDLAFTRLDMQADPATLPAGTVQVSENRRFGEQGATVRGGMARQFPAGASLGELRYAGIYKPEDEEDRFAFVTYNQFWLFDPGTRAITAYPLPDGETVLDGDAVDLVQGGIGGSSTLPLLFILRGWSDTVLQFDGTRVTLAPDVPPSTFGLFYQNRLAVNASRQEIGVSDILDFGAGHWNILNQFQIERGGADYLVGMLPYQKDYVIIAARKKMFVAFFDPVVDTSGYTGGLSNSSFLRLLTTEAGPVGREAMIEAAGLIWFITDNGIYAFQPQLDNQLSVLGQPLSADIQPIFNRLSAAYAAGACIQRFGYRLYFALPISDEPIVISSVNLENTITTGVDLPVDLPCSLAAGGIATIETAQPHGLTADSVVQISNVAGGGLVGRHEVMAVADETHFSIAVDNVTAVIVGTRATVQKLATRNNIIAVYNLNQRGEGHPLGAWESIDTLPSGIYADWLRVADFGTQRRLWLVDAINGPALYEEGDVDEVGDVLGGVNLPVDLPVDLSVANFASVPVRSRQLSRVYRWSGAGSAAFAYGRRVRAFEARLTLGTEDAGTLTCRVRSPGRPEATATETFSGADGTDQPVGRRLSARGLEAEIEFISTSGRPTLRMMEVQTLRASEA